MSAARRLPPASCRAARTGGRRFRPPGPSETCSRLPGRNPAPTAPPPAEQRFGVAASSRPAWPRLPNRAPVSVGAVLAPARSRAERVRPPRIHPAFRDGPRPGSVRSMTPVPDGPASEPPEFPGGHAASMTGRLRLCGLLRCEKQTMPIPIPSGGPPHGSALTGEIRRPADRPRPSRPVASSPRRRRRDSSSETAPAGRAGRIDALFV